MGRMVFLFGYLVGQLIRRSFGRVVGSFNLSASIIVVRMAGGSLAGPLIGRLAGWCICRLVGCWLVGRSLGHRIFWTTVRLVFWWMVGQMLRWVELSVCQSGSRLFG
jgi:hypothetical protein